MGHPNAAVSVTRPEFAGPESPGRRHRAIRDRIIPVGGALAIVFGIVLALLGGALLSDYRSLGTQILKKTMPNSSHTGDPERYRKALGTGYLIGGIILAGVGIVVLGT
jgi:glycerol uptake facilitator-like aquaporin